MKMKKIPLGRYGSWALLALRLAVAAVFLYHGMQKWMFWTTTPAGMPQNMADFFKFLSIVEPLGGLAVLLGFLTRWAALGLGIIMFGAICFKMSMGVPFASSTGVGWEFDLVLLASCVALVIYGGGEYALDKTRK